MEHDWYSNNCLYKTNTIQAQFLANYWALETTMPQGKILSDVDVIFVKFYVLCNAARVACACFSQARLFQRRYINRPRTHSSIAKAHQTPTKPQPK